MSWRVIEKIKVNGVVYASTYLDQTLLDLVQPHTYQDFRSLFSGNITDHIGAIQINHLESTASTIFTSGTITLNYVHSSRTGPSMQYFGYRITDTNASPNNYEVILGYSDMASYLPQFNTLTFVVDDDIEEAQLINSQGRLTSCFCTALIGGTVMARDLYTFLINHEAITYVWNPFEHLTGNDGQFQMNLSMIDASIIGDGETQTSSTDSNKFIISGRTSLYDLSVNMLDNQEYTIAYCGDNYLTMKKRTDVSSSTVIYATLKFYFRSDVLIYTSDEMAMIRTGTTFPNDYYLSIIYDEEHEVAALDCINHFSNVYYYNNFSLPSDEEMRALYIWLQDNGNAQSSDPYGTGSTDNGGNPEGNRQQDHITDSPLPTTGGLNSGFITLYRPTAAQLANIADFLWSDNVLDNFKKYFNNFADNILSLYALPFTPDNLPTKSFKVGNMTSEITNVEYCSVRYFDIDMGQVEIKNKWGSYLDYSPYTRAEIYLPYLGIHSLDIDELMSPTTMDGSMPEKQGTVLSIVYRLDILTGIIVAKIKVRVYSKSGSYTDEIRYQFTGKVGSSIPLTGQTYSSMVNAIITAGAGLATTIATGGLTAPMSAAAAVTATIQAQKPSIERIGSISGDASMLATNVPYICISVPNKPYLDKQELYTGFPSYKADTLGSFEGFTQVIEAHVEGISCTEEERMLILNRLKEGVII